ncbi:MAG: pyridoxal-phosphate dependent enzyme [Pyrobaculum sp.]
MRECLDVYKAFIAEGRRRVRAEEAGCFSRLLDRPVETGEEVTLQELMPRPNPARVFHSPLQLLTEGWPTPLLKISDPPREAYAKLEWYNPFSMSLKDRTVYALLKNLEGERLVEVSSGNVALALGALGNVMGRSVKIYLPSAGSYVAPFLEVLGAEYQILDVTMTVEALEHLEKDIREGAVHPNQFFNDLNFLAHLKTAAEVDWQLAQLGKRPTHVVAGVGTSGHASALGFYFSARYGARLVAVQPRDWVPGIRRVESGMKWLRWVEAEVVEVSLREALSGVREFAKRFGLLIGPSAGAVYYAFANLRDGGVYVLVFPDNLFKYGSLLEKVREGGRHA